MKTLLGLLITGLSTCSTFTSPGAAKPTTYNAAAVCAGIDIVAINGAGEAAESYLTIISDDGTPAIVDATPVNRNHHDIRPIPNPTVGATWQVVIERRENGEVLYTSRFQHWDPC